MRIFLTGGAVTAGVDTSRGSGFVVIFLVQSVFVISKDSSHFVHVARDLSQNNGDVTRKLLRDKWHRKALFRAHQT